MGYVIAHAGCCACGNVFSFNPNLVPSIRMTAGHPDPNGQREPVCEPCVKRANVQRAKNNIPPIEILPGAYEGADEYSIDWNDNRTLNSKEL